MLMLIALTVREALAKKTFMAFFISSTLFLILLIFALRIDLVQSGDAMFNVMGQEIDGGEKFDLENFVRGLFLFSSMSLVTAGFFISVFTTAGFIPSMLEKGTIDLLLSKPLNRAQILAGRTLGALSVVLFNISYLILGIWIIIGLKTSIWFGSFLLVIPILSLIFIIMYSWMLLWGLLLRNTALTIMLTYILVGISGALMGRNQIYALLSSKIWGYILDGLYYTFPRVIEMFSYPIAYFKEEPINYEAFINSAIVALIVYTISYIIFKKKDF